MSSVLGNRIRTIRENAGMNQLELAQALHIGNTTLSQYESGKRVPSDTIKKAIAQYFHVSLDYLMGQTDAKEKYPAPSVTDDVICFPVLGEVAAGFERVALTDWEGAIVEFPRSALRGRPAEDYLALRVCGDSMYPFYLDGDVVLVLLTPELEHSGQVALVRYDGENATLKKVEQLTDGLRLIPLNPTYPPRTISGADLEQCSIIGLPRLLLRNIED